MTLPPDPYSDTSSAAPAPGPTITARGRTATEGMRQLAAIAMLAGNGVFLFLGVSNLLFVVDGWVREFGARSEALFGTFAGPVALALPLLAMLLATHVEPVLPQSRLILLAALAEYAVSGFFGVITYLAGFAEGVFSIRSTFTDLLGRAVWLAFLTIAMTAIYRVYRTMYPPPPPASYAYGPTVYGRPYPGQPSYPRPGNYVPTQGAPHPDSSPTPGSPATAEETVRIAAPSGEATRVLPQVAAAAPEPDTTTLPAPPPAEGGAPER